LSPYTVLWDKAALNITCHNLNFPLNFYHSTYPLAISTFFKGVFSLVPEKVEHFSEVFEKTKAEAALAAGIFHREEVPIEAVKQHMRERWIETR